MDGISRRQWLFRVGSAALGSVVLSSCRPETAVRVDELSARIADDYTPFSEDIGCIACDNCMPCPYGIDIPSNLLFIDEAGRRGYLPGELSNSSFPEKGAEFLSRYEAAVPDPAQSQKCISCGVCLGLCPERINIPKRMSQITALTDLLRTLRCLES